MAKLVSLFIVQIISSIYLLQSSNASYNYNVLNYGAKGDGKTDSAKAFLRAWANACNSNSPATIYVPTGSFLVSQATFNGPCKNTAIKMRIDGTIVAPMYYGHSSSTTEWLVFNNVDGVTIDGGSLDGNGKALWTCKLAGHSCPAGASSLTFSSSKNIFINGLTSMNSKLYHIVLLDCTNVNVRGVNIFAPSNSPNTDGIHVQKSTGVTILQANIKTGDDCVSVGPSTNNLWIERVFCGPGHGISIGSLGKKQGLSQESVHNVTVKTIIFSNTDNGVRIKTWGTNTRGIVSAVNFQDIIMRNVQNPIIIDQNYCPGNQGCPGQNSGIKISGVKYNNIRGTSATQLAVKFDCSPSNPCIGLSLQDIKLSYQKQNAKSSCKYANGITSGFVVPPSCL